MTVYAKWVAPHINEQGESVQGRFGFYDDPIDGAIEISDEEHAALFSAQDSRPVEIVRGADGRPALAEVKTDKNAVKRAAILQQLDELDALSVRPLRAKMAGTATESDTQKLVDLDRQAAALRAQLSSI